MHVIILRGCSGTGKSTWTRNEAQSYGRVQVFSADHFFEDSEGNYNFDPSKLGDAHGLCLRTFATQLMLEDVLEDNSKTTMVIDNTNTTAVEVAPYAQLALAYKRPLKIVTLLCDPEIAHARNAHEVPFKTVKAQHDRLTRSIGKMPKWWNEMVVNVPTE